MSSSILNEIQYKTPTDDILLSRQEFYFLHRQNDESIANWLNRVKDRVDCCKFPKFLNEFLVIDKFVCGLTNTETVTIRCAMTWSFKQIREYFSNENVEKITTEEEGKYLDRNMPIDFVKIEPTDSNTEHEDDEVDSFVDPETKPDETDKESEEDYDANYDPLIDGMKCEFEHYEYSVNDGMVYETIDDAKISTTPFEPNLHCDESIESTESSAVETFVCRFCDVNYSNQAKLDTHLRFAHHVVVMHKCPHCFIDFSEYVDLLQHFTIHNRLKRFKCPMCPMWLLYENDLLRHMHRKHNDKTRITCPNCSKQSQNEKHFIAHFRTKHMKNSDGGVFRCCICVCNNKEYLTGDGFVRHLQKMHQPKQQPCTLCGKQLCVYKRTSAVKKRLPCDQCKKSYTTNANLNKHKRMYHAHSHS